VKKNTVHNRNVFTLAPKNEFGSHFILYLHGGAYVNNFLKQHWDFVSKLIPQTNASIILPDYPLAPESTYKDTLEMVFEVYKDMLSSIDPKNIIFMGDSAGAGLALAMAQKMKIDDIQQPKQIILLSPWLDVSMSNPEAKTIEKRDVLLNIKSLRMAARSYAANTDLKNYLMSPIYGSMSGLAKISIFIGTHDVLYPDCLKIKKSLEEQGISFNFFEYPNLFHVWMVITGLKESKSALSQITKLINNMNDE
jgi:acetyl esterase/lipase